MLKVVFSAAMLNTNMNSFGDIRPNMTPSITIGGQGGVNFKALQHAIYSPWGSQAKIFCDTSFFPQNCCKKKVKNNLLK